jgi:hypothetical protein
MDSSLNWRCSVHSLPPRCFLHTGRPCRRAEAYVRAVGMTCCFVAIAIVGQVADAAGQAPAAPENVQVLSDGDLFVGTTVYVSTLGSDTNPGTQSSPVRTIQRGVALANQVNMAGQASRVLIAAGVYREAVTLNGSQNTDAPMTIEGFGTSTVLSGAENWSTGWTTQADGSLTHQWLHKWGMKAIPNGWDSYWNWDGNGYKRDILRRSEMVYVNGQPLRGVLSLSDLASGTFHVNESTAQLHVRLPSGTSAAQATIEVGVQAYPLYIAGRRNLTLRNFAVERSRGAVQDTAVRIANSSNITVQGLHVRWMAYSGFGTVNVTGLQVRDSAFSDNGVVGMGGFHDLRTTVEDVEIARNNWRGWPAEHKGWDSVHKYVGVRDLMATRLRVINNWGNGFWLDYDNQRITLADSLISGNSLVGINLEKNQGPVAITNSRICNNLTAGVSDAQSERITLNGNAIFANTKYQLLFTGTQTGQYVTDWQTGAQTLNRTRYWTVTDNAIVGAAAEGWLWWHTDLTAWNLFRTTLARSDRNGWFHSARTAAFNMPQGHIAYTAFRTDLQNADAAHEANSIWQATATLSCTAP